MTPALSASAELLLDNPIWHALSTAQRALAEGNELARRFPVDIGPLGSIREQSAAAYDALEEILAGGGVALFLDAAPEPPAHWTMHEHTMMPQMVYDGPLPAEESDLTLLRELSAADVPAMLALTALTEPGPFRARTIELGGYMGIFESGSLAAMAGERLHLPGIAEVSAVCTHPDFRGRGYGKRLVLNIVRRIMQRGETPILHVRSANSAVRLYEALGFKTRRLMHLAVMRVSS